MESVGRLEAKKMTLTIWLLYRVIFSLSISILFLTFTRCIDILRQYNSGIYGYSTGTGKRGSKYAGFNVGYPGDTAL